MTRHTTAHLIAARADLVRYLHSVAPEGNRPPTQGAPLATVAEIKADYQHRSRGHWFDPGAIRFFQCRFPAGGTWSVPGATLFISTEKRRDDPRRATVRAYIHRTAQIETLGDFNAATLTQARAVASQLADEWAAGVDVITGQWRRRGAIGSPENCRVSVPHRDHPADSVYLARVALSREWQDFHVGAVNGARIDAVAA